VNDQTRLLPGILDLGIREAVSVGTPHRYRAPTARSLVPTPQGL
jgi:hypothetical protein